MTIFDRYLLRRYWHVFTITFVALYGLYVIFHAFTNADEFMSGDKSTLEVMRDMAAFYGYRSSQMFDMIGGMVGVIAAMVVFSLVQRYGELNPVLSAGIPTYRLAIPVVWGTAFIQSALVVNQEYVIPRIASQLQIEPGAHREVSHDVEPVYDHITNVLISGKQLHLRDQRIEGPEFVLPVPQIAEELVTLKGKDASYVLGSGKRPGGWLLREATTDFASLRLTKLGSEVVFPGKEPHELFIVTDVSFDRLYKRDRNYQFLSTRELMRRIKNPSFGKVSIRKQSLHLHSRITQKLLNVIVVLLGLPIVARRESRGLITNLALCAIVMGGVFGINQFFLYLGGAHVISTDLAAWAPIMIFGTLSAWMSSMVRT